jgi:hypothetical protein
VSGRLSRRKAHSGRSTIVQNAARGGRHGDRVGLIMSPTASRTLGANLGTAPVYVGPFSYSSRTSGSQISLVMSKYYYDAVAELIGGIDLRDRADRLSVHLEFKLARFAGLLSTPPACDQPEARRRRLLSHHRPQITPIAARPIPVAPIRQKSFVPCTKGRKVAPVLIEPFLDKAEVVGACGATTVPASVPAPVPLAVPLPRSLPLPVTEPAPLVASPVAGIGVMSNENTVAFCPESSAHE